MAGVFNFIGVLGADFWSFLNWLGIHPSMQDLVKALILVLFVLAILMIVGDVYRGEIQNKLHRIKLIKHPGTHLSHDRRDITLQVPRTVVEPTLNGIFSNALIYIRYRDCRGRLQTKRLTDYRVRFKVRLSAIPAVCAANLAADHDYTPDEQERLANEESAAIVSMAESRVDYVYEGLVERFQQRQKAYYERLKGSSVFRFLRGVPRQQLSEPDYIGLCMKFHFPIGPYFLLYKHPDTNVRTTAWLTVLTSVFALFMQLIYSGGTQTADARPPERAQIAEQTSHHNPNP